MNIKPTSPLEVTLTLIMEAKSYNPTSLATAINKKAGRDIVSQTKIWRMIRAESKEPRDSSIEPIANFWGLTVAQIKDIEYIKKWLNGDAEKPHSELRDKLLSAINELPEEALPDADRLLELIREAHKSD